MGVVQDAGQIARRSFGGEDHVLIAKFFEVGGRWLPDQRTPRAGYPEAVEIARSVESLQRQVVVTVHNRSARLRFKVPRRLGFVRVIADVAPEVGVQVILPVPEAA